MDKYEYKIRSEEIKTLIAQGEYAEAAEIADAIDWRRVKSVMMLCTISDLYKINRRYEDARDMLLLAYDRHPGGRTIVYSLCELSIKMEEFVQAVEYYKEFVQIAPKDTGRYILQYKLYEAQEVSLEERIGVLEELKKRDYREKWAYELAFLYHRVGLGTRCVEECDELILWFGEGKYVIKAMELKMLHAHLTPEQQMKYDAFMGVTAEPEPLPENQGRQEEEFQVKTMDVGQYNTINLQKELAEGLKEVLGEPGRAVKDSLTQAIVDPMLETDAMDASAARDALAALRTSDHRREEMQGSEVFFGETGEFGSLEPEQTQTEEFVPEEELPEEEFHEGQERLQKPAQPAKVVSIAGCRATDRHMRELSVEDAPAEELPAADEAPGYAPFAEPPEENVPFAEPPGEEPPEENVPSAEPPGGAAPGGNRPPEDARGAGFGRVSGDTGGIVMEQLRRESMGPAGQPKRQLQPENMSRKQPEAGPASRQETAEAGRPHSASELPRSLADVLAMEGDGQISFVVPEAEKLEKQITGQLNIEDILAEWERMKKDSEERRREAVRKRVMEQTGSMFTEFEASVRDGLLEKLEKENKRTAGKAADPNTDSSEEPLQITVDGGTTGIAEEPAGPSEESDEVEELTEIEDGGEEALPEDGMIRNAAVAAGEAEAGEAEEAEAVDWEDGSFGEAAYEDEGAAPDEENSCAEAPYEDGWEAPYGGDDEEEAEEYFGSEAAYSADAYEADEADAHEDDEADAYEAAEEEAYAAEEEGFGGEAAYTEDAFKADEEETHPAGEGESGGGAAGAGETEGAGGEAGREPEYSRNGERNGERPDVERDQAKLRSLTREEKELYGPYIQNKTAREQLVTAIDNISMAAFTGNVIVTGDEGMDTMTLAKNMIREVQSADSNFSGKVAKISGKSLNRKDVAATLNQFKNGALIIQKASGMEKKAADALNKALQRESFGIVVVMEDTRKAMNRFLKENEELAAAFTARMDVEALSNESLVSFGLKYARELEYSFDEMGILALHTRIEDMQTSDHSVTVMEVKEIVDEAIRHANKKTLGHFFDILLAKRYDDEDMIILREKDFV